MATAPGHFFIFKPHSTQNSYSIIFIYRLSPIVTRVVPPLPPLPFHPRCYLFADSPRSILEWVAPTFLRPVIILPRTPWFEPLLRSPTLPVFFAPASSLPCFPCTCFFYAGSSRILAFILTPLVFFFLFRLHRVTQILYHFSPFLPLRVLSVRPLSLIDLCLMFPLNLLIREFPFFLPPADS